jgi:predicted Fe-Mo cluster-binding NifX family protein
MPNPNFELEVYKAIKAILNNTVTYSSVVVPFYSDRIDNKTRGIYISNYQEQNEDVKDRFGVRATFTIQVYTQADGVDGSNNIAQQVKSLIKASVSSSITSSGIDIVLTKSPGQNRFSDIENGVTTHRVDLTYEILAYSIS